MNAQGFENRADAERWAGVIRAYWARKGHGAVRVEIVTEHDALDKPLYRIESNLKNGLPPALARARPAGSAAAGGAG